MTPVLGFLLLIIISILVRYAFVSGQKKSYAKFTDQIQASIEKTVGLQKKVADNQIEPYLKSNHRVAFFVYENMLDNQRIGYINTRSFDAGLKELGMFYNGNTQAETFKKTLENPDEFKNQYLHIEKRTIFQNMHDQKVKVGIMTMAFFLPGYIQQLPESGAFYNLFYRAWMIFLVSNIMLFPFLMRTKKPKKKVAEIKEDGVKKDQLEWLENKLDFDELEEDTSTDQNLARSGWIELFNQQDLSDWSVKGEWYVKDQVMIAFPWGGSVVTKYELSMEKYEFEVEAQKTVGNDGFIILFRSKNTQLAWVLGGWRNTRSEVVGYPSTVSKDTIVKARWYYVKIESEEEKLSGYLDGRKIWEIEKKDLHPIKENLEFLEGMGVAIWNSVTRFQRVRIVSTDS